MILAGDIGGTNARLALFDVQNGAYKLVSGSVFPSRQYRGLDEIVTKFVSDGELHPNLACFGVAGPVRNGKVETSNLPWVVDSKRLASELRLPSAILINDLEANAWGIAALQPDDVVVLLFHAGLHVERLHVPDPQHAAVYPGVELFESGAVFHRDCARHFLEGVGRGRAVASDALPGGVRGGSAWAERGAFSEKTGLGFHRRDAKTLRKRREERRVVVLNFSALPQRLCVSAVNAAASSSY